MADVPDFLVDAVKRFEGFQPNATWDYKQPSYGYGRKAPYVGAMTTPEESHNQVVSDLGKAADYVDSINPKIPQGPRAALISLTDNAGTGWGQSGLGDLVRAGDWSGAAERIQQYNKAGGHELPGLTTRRQEEASWFNGIPSSTASPPPSSPSVSAGATPSSLGGLLTGAPLAVPDPDTGANDAILAQLSKLYQEQQQRPQPQFQPLVNFLQPNPLMRMRRA